MVHLPNINDELYINNFNMIIKKVNFNGFDAMPYLQESPDN